MYRVCNSKVCERVTMLISFIYIAELSCNIHKPSWQAFRPTAKQECGQKVLQNIQASVYTPLPPYHPKVGNNHLIRPLFKKGLTLPLKITSAPLGSR